MRRVTVTIEADLLAAVDAAAESRGAGGRSEAVRDLLRRALAETSEAPDAGATCLATLSFVAPHAVRDLPGRIAEAQSRHRGLVLSQMQVPVDGQAALHTLILRGPLRAIRSLADALAARRGVRHGRLAVIPAAALPEPALAER